MDGSDAPEQSHLNEFLADVVDGLSKPQKTLACRWLYDEAGSDLFEQITELPEYYPTRTEISILNQHADEIVSALGDDALLIEYGAGASTKTRILLDNLNAIAGYVPIDVSEAFLLYTAETLRRDYPKLDVFPVVGNFMAEIDLPELPSGQRVGFFPGSTIGNLSDDEIESFLNGARSLLGDDSRFLIGVDLRKSPDILVPAYDDAAGVTAAFNLNLLRRINSELDANFDLTCFTHEARWNDEASRIEMHLGCTCDQDITIADQSFHFSAGETIHTENSRKFSIETLTPVFEKTGWTITNLWSDPGNLFAVLLLTAE